MYNLEKFALSCINVFRAKMLVTLVQRQAFPSLVLFCKLERVRFGFQYLYRYLNISFSQSDVPARLTNQIAEKSGKVAVVVKEGKSEPLCYYKRSKIFETIISLF